MLSTSRRKYLLWLSVVSATLCVGAILWVGARGNAPMEQWQFLLVIGPFAILFGSVLALMAKQWWFTPPHGYLSWIRRVFFLVLVITMGVVFIVLFVSFGI